MNRLAPLPTVIPLIAAALAMLASHRTQVRRVIAITALTASLGMSIALLVHADRHGPAVARIGGWSPLIGITYVIDRFSAIMLVISMLTMLVVLVFAIGERAPNTSTPTFVPVYLMLAAGIGAAFSTGDLFHLFVSFEILLMASYVLLTLDGDEAQVRAGTTYVVINVIESIVLVVAVGLVYASTGSLSMAELPSRLAALDDGLRTGLQLLLLVAFGLKAAVFPLFFWLPDSYPTARSPITAVFAGLLTKVGVYAIVRTQTQLFPGEHRTLLLWIAGLTMIVGVLGAIAQNDVKRILSFHIVSQIGYMVLGIAIGGPAAIAATVFFLIHQIPVKTSLFLVDGLIGNAVGHEPARPAERPGPPLRLPRRAVPAPGAEPVGHPAVLRVRRQARPAHRGHRRPPGRARRRGHRRQPADAGVDDQDLALGVLGRPGDDAAGVARRRCGPGAHHAGR